MRSIISISFVLLFLTACTTERVITPSDPKRASELNAQLGLGYLQQGQYKRALKKLDKAIDFDSNNADAYHYKAEIYRRLEQHDEAEKYFKQAIEIAPQDQTLQNNYGVYLCDTGKYDQAISIFEKSLADPLYENKASLYENIGLCRQRQGRIRQAESAFTQALAYNPKMAKSLIQIAQISYDSGHRAAAYDYFNRYISIANHTPESLWLGILLEHGRGAKNTVASYKVKLKGKFPDSKQAKLLEKLEKQGKL